MTINIAASPKKGGNANPTHQEPVEAQKGKTVVVKFKDQIPKSPSPPKFKEKTKVVKFKDQLAERPLLPKFNDQLVIKPDGSYGSKEADGVDETTSKTDEDDIFRFTGASDPAPRFKNERTTRAADDLGDFGDQMYHINAGPGTHSGVLERESNPMFEDVLQAQVKQKLGQIKAAKAGPKPCPCKKLV